MATILDRYGIKEVADVTFYKINSDGSMGAPVLYLDTLKVSTIEQTADQAEARGGKGNPPLVIWDYGKEINVTLEDALFSAKSMAIMFGDGNVKDFDSSEIIKTLNKANVKDGKFEMAGKSYALPTSISYFHADGTAGASDSWDYCQFKLADVDGVSLDGGTIEISANSFPGTYYVTGDTYARSETTGEDEFFQFIIPKAKVLSENTITLEAEGDPSVFNMNLRVMRPADGKMMKLVKYTVGSVSSEG